MGNASSLPLRSGFRSTEVAAITFIEKPDYMNIPQHENYQRICSNLVKFLNKIGRRHRQSS